MCETDQSGTPQSRGVTNVLNYALLLVIVALLVSGLLIGVGDFVEGQQERAIRSQLTTVGNQLAADIGTTDRLVETEAVDNVQLRSDLPDSVGGSQYRITVTGSGPLYTLVLRSSEPEVETTVPVRTTKPLSGTVSGGPVVLTSNGSAVVVAND